MIVGIGGLEREMEKPFHTERAQSARVAFMTAAPVDESWAENVRRKNLSTGCYGQDLIG